MNDWRLANQDKYLMGVTLNEILFPNFWVEAFNSKNDFYLLIENEAKEFVKQYGRGYEYLEGMKIGAFWHEHCEFCTEEINTDKKMKCYCTTDRSSWICEKCFNDFKNMFHWKVIKQE